MKREKFVEVGIEMMFFLPAHMQFLVVRERDWIPFWPVIGKHTIKEMEEKGAETVKYKGYKYIHAKWYLDYLRGKSPDDFLAPLLKLHLYTFFMKEDEIMKEEAKYKLVITSPEECILEKCKEK